MPKIKLGYDNFEDAKTKLNGTYCLYRGKAVQVVAVWPTHPDMVDNGIYKVDFKYMMSGGAGQVAVDDPEFNCSEFNIGYLNRVSAASWFYRVPIKQYKQGLRYDQVHQRASNRNYHGIEFKPGKPLAMMLENNYPGIEAAAKALKDQEANIVAFHKNFAITYDRIHSDYITEYKGETIGYTKNLEDFKFTAEYEHLTESLKEAVA